MHGDGLCLEQSFRRRAALHAEPGRAQRRDHGVRLRSDRRSSSRPVGDHSAVGDIALVGGSLHRGAGHHRTDRAAERARDRGKASADETVVRPSADFARGVAWFFYSAFRASRFLPNR